MRKLIYLLMCFSVLPQISYAHGHGEGHSHASSHSHTSHEESSAATETSSRGRDILGAASAGVLAESIHDDDTHSTALARPLDGYPMDGTPGAFPAVTPEDTTTETYGWYVIYSVIGGVVFLATLSGIIFYIRRRCRHNTLSTGIWWRFPIIRPGLISIQSEDWFFENPTRLNPHQYPLHHTRHEGRNTLPVVSVGKYGDFIVLYTPSEIRDIVVLRTVGVLREKLSSDALYFSFYSSLSQAVFDEQVGKPIFYTEDGCAWSYVRDYHLGLEYPSHTRLITETCIDQNDVVTERKSKTALYVRETGYAVGEYTTKEYLLIRSFYTTSGEYQSSKCYTGVSVPTELCIADSALDIYVDY